MSTESVASEFLDVNPKNAIHRQQEDGFRKQLSIHRWEPKKRQSCVTA